MELKRWKGQRFSSSSSSSSTAERIIRRTSSSSHIFILSTVVLGVICGTSSLLVFHWRERFLREQQQTAIEVQRKCQKYRTMSSSSSTLTRAAKEPQQQGPLLSFEAAQEQLCTAMDTVEPFVTTREKMSERWDGYIFPLAQDYSIEATRQLVDNLTTTDNKKDRMLEQRVLYVVTPTYQRPSQMVDMVRMKQTLQLASMVKHRHIYWIVIEDAVSCTQRIRNLILDSGLDFAHVTAQKSPDDTSKHRGVAQRNRALDLIEHEVGIEGVVYFGDDDNAYDIQLFPELLTTRKLSALGVAFTGSALYEGYHVNPETGKIDRMYTNWGENRKYQVDMAGFAFSTAALIESKARFQTTCRRGHLESAMIDSIVNDLSEVEPLAANCTRILAWHVRTDGVRTEKPHATTEAEHELMQRLV